MAREGTKTAAAIAVMVKHADKPMEAVLPLIAKATGHDLPHARNYYVWCVRKGVAPGVIPARASKPKTEKAPKVKAPKTVSIKTVMKKAGKAYAEKKAAAKTKAEAVVAVTKSPEEIERIKAANLARMKSVMARVKQEVRKPDTEEIPFSETDSFAAPAFLSKDEVTALV